MTALILFIISRSGNNLLMMGPKPGLIKVEDVVTVAARPRKDEGIDWKEGRKKREVVKKKKHPK